MISTKVVNRKVFSLAAVFLLTAGICPKFSAVLTTIPQCVLGGATVTVFSTIAMTGITLIFGKSPVVVAIIMAVLLNQILPRDDDKAEE